MIDVLIIDQTDRIAASLPEVGVNVQRMNDEVKALNALEQNGSAVVLLHYSVMQQQTSDYINVLLKASSNSNIVVIADDLAEEEVLSCLLAGAKGYQQLNQLKEYASKLITVIDAGEAWITRRMTATLLDTLRQR